MAVDERSPRRIGLILVLAAAVGIGAFILGAVSSSHATQAPATPHPTQTAATAMPSGKGSSASLPPSLFNAVPCDRCLMAHLKFWSSATP